MGVLVSGIFAWSEAVQRRHAQALATHLSDSLDAQTQLAREAQYDSASALFDQACSVNAAGDATSALHAFTRALSILESLPPKQTSPRLKVPCETLQLSIRNLLGAVSSSVGCPRRVLPIELAAVSTNGAYLAAHCDDGMIRVWDVLADRFRGEPSRVDGRVRAIAINSTGGIIATCSDAGQVHVRDVSTGAIRKQLVLPAPGRDVMFCGDGSKLVTTEENGTIRVWNAESLAEVGSGFVPHGPMRAIAVDHSAALAALATGDTLRLLNANTGDVLHSISCESPWFGAVVISPNGSIVASCHEDNAVRLWRTDTGVCVGTPLEHPDSVEGLAFSPDSAQVATGCWDGVVRLWNCDDTLLAGTMDCRSSGLYSVCFSRDGRLVGAASLDHKARIWSRSALTEVTGPLQHKGPVHHACFSPDSSTLITTASDGTASLWTTETSKADVLFRLDGLGRQTCAFGPLGDRIVATDRQHEAVGAWSIPTGRSLGPSMEHLEMVVSMCVSRDGRRYATASLDRTARLWDASSHLPIGEPFVHSDPVTAVAIDGDGSLLALGGNEGSVWIWDVKSRKQVCELVGHTSRVSCIALDTTRTFVAAGADDGTVRVWNLRQNGRLRFLVRHSRRVGAIAFDAAGTRVATGGWDGVARLWDVADGAPVGAAMLHAIGIVGLAFDPSDDLLATASWDHSAQLWDVATQKAIGDPYLHHSPVVGVSFGPDRSRLFSATLDSTVSRWAVAAPWKEDLDGVVKRVEALTCRRVFADESAARLSVADFIRVQDSVRPPR